ncbi:MAG: type II toxin-antitoxin system Phd/YefM family antitoxin [Chloroflexia bacterium]|nr:type II toxin-antitoxin system Phd/YefM family antitoxin [Chloroflexia bacterium]MDQ3410966.1 type II toxin-antitoxin system Phd/YefM family antitoxin [Chloroflexota bacterium]
MFEPQPKTRTMKISEVRSGLNTLVNEIYREETRVVVAKSGIPVAALVSIDDLERLDRLDQEREERFKVIDKVREAFRGVPDEEIERETDRILGINQELPQSVSSTRE